MIPIANRCALCGNPSHCTKLKYESESGARAALARCQAQGRDEVNTYKCNLCGWWHLTSKHSVSERAEVIKRWHSQAGYEVTIERYYKRINSEPEVFQGIRIVQTKITGTQANHTRILIPADELSLITGALGEI